MPFWYAVKPLEDRNLLSNPSGELGTTGWGTYLGQSGTVGTIAGTAVFGAWAGSVAPGAPTLSGATFGTITAGLGTLYSFSAYVRGAVGSQYQITIHDSSNNVVGSTTFTTGGTYQQYRGSYTEGAGATRYIGVRKLLAGNDLILVDGVRVQVGTAGDTYIDGDQEGCAWVGDPHNSQSFRSGQSRAGGSVVALADLGLTVLEMSGVGMAPVENIAQPYALLDGANYQRTRTTTRTFALTTLVSGTTWAGMHALRQRAIDLVKPDLVSPQQPTRFLYTGAGGTTAIDAFYDDGLGFENRDGFSETFALRMVAFDPYWEATTDQGTALLPQVNLGSVNYITYRDPVGKWGTMGASVNNQIYDITSRNGTVYAVGAQTQSGGTGSGRAAFWVNGNWGTFSFGTLGGNHAEVVTITPSGTLYVGGDLNSAGGTASQYLFMHRNGQWGTLTGGTVDNQVNALAFAPWGTLYVGGLHTTAGGTASNFLSQWNGNWGTMLGGSITYVLDNFVRAIVVTRAGSIVFGGNFSTVAGTLARFVGQHNTQAFGTLTGGTFNAEVYAIAQALDARLYMMGGFGSVNSTTLRYITVWNGVGYTTLNQGLSAAGDHPLAINPRTGQLASGALVLTSDTLGSLAPLRGLGFWTGANWLPGDIYWDNPGAAAIRVLHYDAAGTLYMGGGFNGTAQAAAVANIVNTSSANSPPRVTMRNTGAGIVRVIQLVNQTTGQAVYCNIPLFPSETLTMTFAPGSAAIRSDFQGNQMGRVLPGAIYSNWALAPGTNAVSVFANSGSLQVAIAWRGRYWSNDGTT